MRGRERERERVRFVKRVIIHLLARFNHLKSKVSVKVHVQRYAIIAISTLNAHMSMISMSKKTKMEVFCLFAYMLMT